MMELMQQLQPIAVEQSQLNTLLQPLTSPPLPPEPLGHQCHPRQN